MEYRCDYRMSIVPQLLQKPDQNDYLTDEESDDCANFEVKVPELDELISQFEKGDGVINGLNEQTKEIA